MIDSTITAVNEKREYQTAIAISLYFETDDTNAKDDCVSFGNLMRQVGIEHQILKLYKTEYYLQTHRTFNEMWERLVKHDKALVIVHYAGHGSVNDGMLHFHGTCGEGITWGYLCSDLIYAVALNHVDMFVVIDSCYSGTALRGPPSKKVSVLAACPADRKTDGRGHKVSFTQKLCAEADFQLRKLGWLRTDSLYAALLVEGTFQNAPQLKNSGPVGITIPLMSKAVKPANPPMDPPVTVYIACHLLIEETPVKELCRHLQSLNTLHDFFRVSVSAKYASNSTVIILEVPAWFANQLDPFDNITVLPLATGPILTGHELQNWIHNTASLPPHLRPSHHRLESHARLPP